PGFGTVLWMTALCSSSRRQPGFISIRAPYGHMPSPVWQIVGGDPTKPRSPRSQSSGSRMVAPARPNGLRAGLQLARRNAVARGDEQHKNPKPDIEIAQAAAMRPIGEVATEKLG